MIRTSNGIPESEFSPTFVQGMYDRMAVSFCKYGLVADAYPSRVNALESLLMRLVRYMGVEAFRDAAEHTLKTMNTTERLVHRRETGNTEYLMDAANFAMIEYMRPRHERAYFKPTDSHESPGRMFEGTATDRRNDAEVRRLYRQDGD